MGGYDDRFFSGPNHGPGENNENAGGMMTAWCKSEVARLWRMGAFGNKLRSWQNVSQVQPELRESLRFGLRSLVPGGVFRGHLTYDEACRYFDPAMHYVCEAAPDEYRLFQGELSRGIGGLHFVWSAQPMTLREALLMTDGTVRRDTGIIVEQMLRAAMSPSSFIEVMDCLDLHEDAIVEFTVFFKDVGERSCRNAVIWEVRVGF